ncbi:MAG: hypothetical protein WD646_12705 [Actinomycetota bacterium]
MLLGGALPLLAGLLVLGIAAFVVLGVWLVLGRRDEAPLRNPYTAYLGIVLFVSFLAAFASLRGLTSSIAAAIADQPLGYSCTEPAFTDEETIDVPPPGEFLDQLPPGIRRQLESSARLGAASEPPVAGQISPVRPPQPVRPEFGDVRTPACMASGARSGAGRQAAESGTILIVALGIMMFHARAGQRLLEEEKRDA